MSGPDGQRRGKGEHRLREALTRAAADHYGRGNRFFEHGAWARAAEEWGRAAGMWRTAGSAGRLIARRLLHLRAALAFLATVIAIYAAVFTLFPRDPFDMLLLTGRGLNSGSWWERFLDSGRPQTGGGHKMGIREWWERLQRDLLGGGDGQVAARRGGRPSIDERWEQLLRRYGRWGPYFNFELDYNVVSGYGLSRMDDYAEAVRVFEAGIAKARRPEQLADLYQGLANAHYYRGYRLQPNGLAEYDLHYVRKSTEAYEASLRNQPRPISYGNLGWMYFLLGDYDKSVEFSRRALELDGGLDYVRLNMGLAHLVQDKLYRAFDAYRAVVRRNPPKDVFLGGINDLREILRDHEGRYPFAHLMVGLLALKQGDHTLARDALERFLVAPYMGQQWRRIAETLLQAVDPAEVVR